MPEWIPAINLVLGLIGACWLTVRTAHRWSEYPDEIRLTLTLAIGLYIGLITVSAEMITLEGVPFVSTIVVSLVKIFSLVVLYQTSSTKYRTGTRQADGNPNADPNLDIR